MPMFIEEAQGQTLYQPPFVGRLDYTLHLLVDVSSLTTSEVDAGGRLVPGLPLTRAGRPVAAQGSSTAATAIADDDNTGNGTVSSLAGKVGGKAEVITLKARSATSFEVRGSRSGTLADATVGAPYTSAAVNFTLTAGATAFVAGDEFTVVLTEAAPDVVFGIVPEATPIVAANPTDASLAATTHDVLVAVGVIGVANRDAIETNLGRVLSAAEIAAFESGQCKLVLSRV